MKRRKSNTVVKAVRVRLYPTDEQKTLLAQSFGCVRYVWNRCLGEMTETYRTTGKGISATAMQKNLPIWKTEHEWLKVPYSQVLQQTLNDLSTAFDNFFEKRAAYPNFKKKHGKNSIRYPQKVTIQESSIKFPGSLGIVKAKLHRMFEGEIKSVTVSQDKSGMYHASVLIDTGKEKPAQSKNGDAVGIDLGLIDLAVTSDGSKFKMPSFKKHQKNLKRKQRKLSKMKDKTTKNRKKRKIAVAKVSAKIARKRSDFLHKLSRKLVDDNQVIVAENLAVKNMVKNHNLARAISEQGWGTFCTMLKYKAEAEGKIYIEVDRFFPSSHLCSETLLPIPKMGLDIRSFDCSHCGKTHDRDVNAAINIKNEGLRLLASGSGATALGGDVSPVSSGRKKSRVDQAIPYEQRSPLSIA